MVNIAAMAKRILLFLALNILVVFTISILLNILNVKPYLSAYGLDYTSLAIFCLIWGMVGALMSLALSRVMAKFMMRVQVVDPDTREPRARWLHDTISRLAQQAGLPNIPEVGIYPSSEINAFATGPTKSRSLVAVSAGLLNQMDKNAIEGILGHEISHIANGDMVTMTLVQGVINAFVMFFARVIAYAISAALSRGRESRHINSLVFYIVTQVLELVFMIFGMMVVTWFSRQREYRADNGGAQLAGRGTMIHALQALQRTVSLNDPSFDKPAVQTLKISTHHSAWTRFFMTHPPLEDRIARLQSTYSV